VGAGYGPGATGAGGGYGMAGSAGPDRPALPAGRSAMGATRPVARTRRSASALRSTVTRWRTLPVRTGGHSVGHRSGAGAGPVSTGSATDAVGVGSEAGIGRRFATHPAKLPS
jgi:hypothetical protein